MLNCGSPKTPPAVMRQPRRPTWAQSIPRSAGQSKWPRQSGEMTDSCLAYTPPRARPPARALNFLVRRSTVSCNLRMSLKRHLCGSSVDFLRKIPENSSTYIQSRVSTSTPPPTTTIYQKGLKNRANQIQIRAQARISDFGGDRASDPAEEAGDYVFRAGEAAAGTDGPGESWDRRCETLRKGRY